MVNVDGTGEQALTSETAPSESEDPAFSPDGTMIVFARGSTAGKQLFTMRADGSAKQAITPLVAGQTDNSPNWQPLAPPPPPPPPPSVKAPRISVSGVSAAGCRTANFRANVTISDALKVSGVDVFVDGKRIVHTHSKHIGARVLAKKLASGSHTIKIAATNSAGKRTVMDRALHTLRAARPTTAAPAALHRLAPWAFLLVGRPATSQLETQRGWLSSMTGRSKTMRFGRG